jgi:ribonuclease P protein component
MNRAVFARAAAGKRFSSAHLTLVASPAVGGVSSYAAVISKKTAARAVDRNLLRRRLYAVLRAKGATPRSYIVYAKGGAVTLPFATLQSELETLLRAAA